MPDRIHLKIGAAVTLLMSSSAVALAQAPAGGEAPPAGGMNQTTENPVVPVADATHVAQIGTAGGEAEAFAWLRADPQNNTLMWTIEYTGAAELIAVSVYCPTEAPVAAPARANEDPMAAAAAGVGFDIEGLVEALNLVEDATIIDSPIQGEAAALTDAVFNHITQEGCALVLDTVAAEGGELTGHIVRLTGPAAGG